MLPKKKIDELVEYWIITSEEDVKTMQALYKTGRYAFCLFIGHLVLEKALKALVVLKSKKEAPKIHNLPRLAQMAEVDLEEAERKLLSHANEFNMEARYPSVKQKFYNLCTKTYTDEFYGPIISLYHKLCQKLNSEK